MPGPRQSFRFAISGCAVAGLGLTAPRRRLLEVLSERGTPQVVEALVHEVSTECAVHPVTIYRFVAALESKGIVHRLMLRGQRALMLACESLDYLVCDSCGRVTRFVMPEGFRDWENALATVTGYRLAHHWFEISGVCQECQQSGKGRETC